MSQHPQQRGNASSRLPAIEHPMAKMAGSGSMDVRGSADAAGGSRPGTVATGAVAADAAPGKRPLPSEEAPLPAGSRASSRGPASRHSQRSHRGAAEPAAQPRQHLRHQTIPEGVEIVHGELDKARLPVFGVRARAAEAALERARNGLEDEYNGGDERSLRSSNSSRLSEVQSARLELDEIESLIREKVRSSYYEIRKRFVDNDPEQKGNVTRDALLRIIVSTIGRPVSLRQLSQLFERISLRQDKQIVSFAEFFAGLRDQDSLEHPNWMDPVNRQRQDRAAKLSAEQVHSHLTETMRQRFVDMADVFPQFVDGGTGRMLKHELRSSLSKMNMTMSDDEFERLWRIYDPRDTGTVNGVAMLKKMGIVMRGPKDKGPQRYERQPPQRQQQQQLRPPLKAEEDRQRSLTIEAWLKDKFREGFHRLKAAFEARDSERTGLVSHDDFLAVLREHSLSLEKLHLAEFLARCAVTHTKAGVMYRDFLHRFQDRSEAGMAHKIMTNPHHTKEPDDTTRSLSSVEKQLMNMFQRDFLSLLSALQKIDRHGLSVVSQEQFRAVMESRFGFELTDAQFKAFVEKLPLNSEGYVRYDVFLRQFDTKGMAPSLFKSVGDGASQSEEGDEAGSDSDGEDEPFDPNKRSVTETRRCIRHVLHHRFQDVEVAFYELDTFNSGRLTQEMMHQLLNRFIKPEVTRGEVRDLWKTFYLRQREALDYQEFLRAFIFNPLTAAFPNAKLFPPKKGDSDLMMRSRKVNSDVNLLEDGLRAKIEFLWDKLRDEFVDMDPYGTGCVSREEFQEVLKELSIQLTDYELSKLTDKFTQKSDGRVNYVELLRPFAYKKFGPRRHHMNEVLSQATAGRGPAAAALNGNSAVLQQISAKLRAQLSGEWKNLRRHLMKLDPSHSGLIDLAEFRSVLKLFHVVLDEEEVFQLMSSLDTNLSGKVPYKRVLDMAQPVRKRKGPSKTQRDQPSHREA